MIEYKEKWYVKLLKWLGIIKEYEISKADMCRKAQSVCERKCECCAWNNDEVECKYDD